MGLDRRRQLGIFRNSEYQPKTSVKGIRLTNRTYHFAAKFAEVGG